MTQETDTQELEETQLENSMQFLSFTLGEEEYGVDILSVQEIRSWEPVSRIPNVPSYEKGVVNLRGAIVPIIDLRERFNLEHSEYTNLTVVVVLQTILQGRSRTMGLVVDSVSDVNNIDLQSIQSAPDFGTKVSTEFISGLALVEERMLILLDVKKLLKLDGVDDAAEDDNDES
ncbi:chemotaxis protein CheW [methanotrophic endosymbiont of Bathymodiolus puteoserpentis (Logatchev)]|jgi:purine-binding chemotaxis protein CheW|uniref:chemotaxis protein CheW n=1 Tax=methanotrophic endosymbiont of Bathymodiolus puteoserpentis (Logatchev) TaxID=343235 RepID=UPI0013CCF4A9|nr:chemotaxis protein CheW [methanotrophic endosymbiont of Bathymodiolus puteoserpentis (Logatchev)]SHE23473.1 Positive regulator of CheA protein activity (CheW) [methanotrophic endosymbiont of Bathymodiolus puteoserpentis (Logatchev)]